MGKRRLHSIAFLETDMQRKERKGEIKPAIFTGFVYYLIRLY